MRFLVDENLSPLLAQALRDADHDAAHVRDMGLASADDVAVLAAAREDHRILISADTDFGGLLAETDAALPSFILIRRLQGRRAAEQAALLADHMTDIQADLVRGAIVAIDEDRIRIRLLPISRRPGRAEADPALSAGMSGEYPSAHDSSDEPEFPAQEEGEGSPFGGSVTWGPQGELSREDFDDPSAGDET